MLSSFEYELYNKEYIRCLNLINTYSKNGQKCIIFKLKLFECLISHKIYNNVLTEIKQQLERDNFDVYSTGSELLIFWDKRENKVNNKNNETNESLQENTFIKNSIVSVNTTKKKKKNDENISIDHIKLTFGNFEDLLPIRTGNY